MKAVAAVALLNRLEKLDCELVSMHPSDITGLPIQGVIRNTHGGITFVQVNRMALITQIRLTHSLIKRKSHVSGNCRGKPRIRHNKRFD